VIKHDMSRKCSKCGAGAGIKYLPERDLIERKCSNCGNIWMEAPIDRNDENNNSEGNVILG